MNSWFVGFVAGRWKRVKVGSRWGQDDARKIGFILFLPFAGRDSTELTILQLIISLGVVLPTHDMAFHYKQRILYFIVTINYI